MFLFLFFCVGLPLIILAIYLWVQTAQFFLTWLPTLEGTPGWFTIDNGWAWAAFFFGFAIVCGVAKFGFRVAWTIILLPFLALGNKLRSAGPVWFFLAMRWVVSVGASIYLTDRFLEWTDANPQFTDFYQPEHWYAWLLIIGGLGSIIIGSTSSSDDD